jgi:nitroreductase
MQFSELVRVRQSVRAYQGKPVEKEKLNSILEALRLAPSASNGQPWKVIVVDDPELKNKVAKAAFSSATPLNKFSLTAPVIIVLTVEKMKLITQVSAWLKKREFSLVDIGIAAEHFCLQAAELGLGSCIIGWFDEDPIKELLHIPKNKKIGLLITLGYPADGYEIRQKKRKDFQDIIQFNKYKED